MNFKGIESSTIISGLKTLAAAAGAASRFEQVKAGGVLHASRPAFEQGVETGRFSGRRALQRNDKGYRLGRRENGKGWTEAGIVADVISRREAKTPRFD